MTVTVTLTVSADEFVFGQLLADNPETTVHIERVVPLGNVVSPFIWVSGDDSDGIGYRLVSDPDVVDAEKLVTGNDESLYRIEFREEVGGLIECLVETEATVLEAVGRNDEWRFVTRFADHELASEFQQRATDRGISLDVRSIHNPAVPPTEGRETKLTPPQREALVRAYSAGYFKVPRRASLTSLAEEMGISDSALSQRLRRGIERLVEADVFETDSDRY
ncbi:helix-turn-helix domain-containing protein [Halobium salinum]|uniref:Helix-turn-helix domain-containing protein n=1 Tax=Halobium salinum TaxID=1364940 RepID=A0ABD5PCJ0_9EURY|nr:helix-turn-helix domain-containing protein [Halobium salinum]